MTDIQWKEIKHFAKQEFACKCGCGKEDMNYNFIKDLDEARDIAQVPFSISSGFRCAKHNKAEGGVADSSHIKNIAVDIRCTNSTDRFSIVDALLQVGLTRIGISGNFIHVDRDNDKTQEVIWTY